jgi:hypothetical protein
MQLAVKHQFINIFVLAPHVPILLARFVESPVGSRRKGMGKGNGNGREALPFR